MSRKHFHMSRDEFLYEHDVIGIAAMIKELLPKDQKEGYETEEFNEISAVDFL